MRSIKVSSLLLYFGNILILRILGFSFLLSCFVGVVLRELCAGENMDMTFLLLIDLPACLLRPAKHTIWCSKFP